MNAALKNIERLTDSRYPLVYLETNELDVLFGLFRELGRGSGKAIYQWNREDGMYRLDAGHIVIPRTQRPENVLEYIQSSKHYGIYLLRNLGADIEQRPIVDQLKRIAAAYSERPKMVILIDNKLNIPVDLRPSIAHVRHVVNHAEQDGELARKAS